ncbi:ccch zinc finger domain-containing [Trichoderma arundinaceum]|uniref:Ccch zinc finger domain-containing n=1 Tax=Trichoderma arundinaceum TaxID=490622 RepID=A0A395NVQ6_TRIAR|nr:ccch zinc finger domain-containing [Trichoderma arundinaceum]
MAVCRFYQQGYCKFGNSCRYEHTNAGGNRNQSSNRFGALGGTNTGGNESALSKYSISPDVIEKDLTIEAPQWILSAYAPGRDAPDQLFGGYPREQSFEELRLHYLVGKASGNEQQALNEAQQLYQNAKQQMESAARNPTEAARFIVEGENRHPNRHDVCKEGTQGAPFGEFLVGRRSNSSANPFGGNTGMSTATATASAFGQPSAMGQRPNPFGQPSSSTFGQPSQASSSFGQPAQASSTFGQPSQPTSAFGQPSALGAKPSPFGAPAFGQASQPNTQSNPFGQSQPQQGNAFGQPSQLGQKPNPFGSTAGAGPSSFASAGNAAAPAANPFGSSNANQGGAASNPFGSNNASNAPNPFGQPTQQAAASPFGQPSAPAANPFATAAQGPASNAGNPFAQQTSQQQAPFGAPSNQDSGTSFGQNNASPFGQQQQQPPPQSGANPFAQNQTNGNSPQANPFAAAQQPAASGSAAGSNNPYPPSSSRQHPPIESYSQKTMDGRLAMFKGKPVTYQDGQPGIRSFDGTWTRIWFANGPPGYNRDTELPLEEYSDALKTQWTTFAKTGAFADGVMPELPPPRVCTRWDF